MKQEEIDQKISEAYSRGVSAGKQEAANYTPQERERYGRWVAQGDLGRLRLHEHPKLQETLGLDAKHVIIDRDEYEVLRRYFGQRTPLGIG